MAVKLNIEELKKAKDGLDVIHDIHRYSQTGFADISPTDFPLFRWYGLYQQRPNEGHFMLRVKIPNGHMTSAQLRELGQISIDHGRNLADITTRQTFQYHWLTIDKVPEIFARLKAINLFTPGACGDITRNIVGCPVAGIDCDEILDARPLLEHCSELIAPDKAYSNLPRKYKISISGCRIHCAQPQINCVGFYGAEQGGEAGYGLLIGGGLSTNPYFGADMGVFLKPDEVVPVLIATTEIYRDAPQLRENRGRARLKFLMHDPKIGIGRDAFRAQIEEKIGGKMRDGGPFPFPRESETDHLGIRRQKQDGLWYLGVGVRAGRLSGEMLIKIADIADEFSNTATIRNTNKQNFIITDIPEAKLELLKARLDELDLDYNPSIFKKALVSCTGIEFCNLAVTETKELGRRVSVELDERFPDASKKVRIHFSGCPNNCGQNAIADIGLRGKNTKGPEGLMIQAFDILLGGVTGGEQSFGEMTVAKFPADRIGWAIGNLYQGFLDWAADDKARLFQDYVRTHTKTQLDAVARGLPMPAAELEPAGAPADDEE